ncbi:MAG: 4Fe-4S cluster-binding domain-containing protein [Candidatus Helarchaeota archaeon]
MPGYLVEIFSSYQGEGFAVESSCYGKRQCFIRFGGCNLAIESKACIWCDSLSAQRLEIKKFRIEKTAGHRDFIYYSNPVDEKLIYELIAEISSPDLHSISITGGEPLHQIRFLSNLARKLSNFKLYLETNGTLPKNASKIVDYFDYCCCDIKDQSAINTNDWKKIVELEFQTIGCFVKAGKKIFAKVVVTKSTKTENIEWYAEKLAELGVPLAIQIVSSQKNPEIIPEFNEICKMTEAAAKYLSPDQIGISLQTHKFMNYL